MTLFTVGRLQAFERMMQQTSANHGRDSSAAKQPEKKVQNNKSKQIMKDGERRGCNKS